MLINIILFIWFLEWVFFVCVYLNSSFTIFSFLMCSYDASQGLRCWNFHHLMCCWQYIFEIIIFFCFYFISNLMYSSHTQKKNIFHRLTFMIVFMVNEINFIPRRNILIMNERDRDKSLAESSSTTYVLLLFHSLKIRHSFSSFNHEKTEIEWKILFKLILH